MEDNVIWDIIISNLPAILTALGGVLVIYLNYKKDLKKDLQQYVLELNKSQNERIERLSEDNAEQQAEVARLTQKIEAMKEEIDELKMNLSKEYYEDDRLIFCEETYREKLWKKFRKERFCRLYPVIELKRCFFIGLSCILTREYDNSEE